MIHGLLFDTGIKLSKFKYLFNGLLSDPCIQAAPISIFLSFVKTRPPILSLASKIKKLLSLILEAIVNPDTPEPIIIIGNILFVFLHFHNLLNYL